MKFSKYCKKVADNQELYTTPGPGDLSEHESTLHRVLVVSGPQHQRQWEPSGRLRPSLPGKNRHIPLVPLRRGSSLKDLQTVGRVLEGCG